MEYCRPQLGVPHVHFLSPTTLAEATATDAPCRSPCCAGRMGRTGPSARSASASASGASRPAARWPIVEHPFPLGALVPPHVHTREDEFSIVTAGAIGFRSGSDEVVLEAGGYISKPRGSCTRCGTPARSRRA